MRKYRPPVRLERLLALAIRATRRVQRGSFTAGSVVVVRNRSGEVLLLRPWYRHSWGFPGGFIERQETLDGCAARELREETGIDAPALHYIEALVQHGHKHIDFVFAADVEGDPSIRAQRSEIAEFRWVSERSAGEAS